MKKTKENMKRVGIMAITAYKKFLNHYGVTKVNLDEENNTWEVHFENGWIIHNSGEIIKQNGFKYGRM